MEIVILVLIERISGQIPAVAHINALVFRIGEIAAAGRAAPFRMDRHRQGITSADVIAGEPGNTVPQVALNWLLQRPTVSSVIIGARNEDQLRQNLGTVGWNLTPEQVATWMRPAP